ncbi:MAG: hypothetical protein KQI81_19200 [Deltaproteobacteria bacterium]|nr:hypothetical protein [Deltaproteobacteria bacterium]
MITRLWPFRRLISRCGAIIGIIFVVSAMDTFVSGHLDRKNMIRVVTGSRQPVSGDLNQPVRRIFDVQYQLDMPGAQLIVEEVKGRFWRGTLTVPPALPEGVYTLNAFAGKGSDPAEEAVYRIAVFASVGAMNASTPSLFRRTLGIAPWWISAAALPLLMVSLALSFHLTTRRESLLMEQGLVPIIKMARRKDHWELVATLVQKHRLAAGNCLEVMDRNMQAVARLIVTGIEDQQMIGRVELSAPITPDGFVRIFPLCDPA